MRQVVQEFDEARRAATAKRVKVYTDRLAAVLGGPTDFAALARMVAEVDAATGGPDDRSNSDREQESDAARARTPSPSGRRSRNRTVSVDAREKRSKTETPVEEEDEELEREEFPRQISDDRRKQETDPDNADTDEVDRVIESAAARDEARTQSPALAVPDFEREVSGANAIFPPSSRANSNQEEEDDERPAEEDRDQEEKTTEQQSASSSSSSTIAPATPATPLVNRHPSLLTAKSTSMSRAPSILHTPTAAVASTPSSIDRSIKVASSSTSPGRTRSMSAATRPSQPAPRSERSCYFASFMKTANDGSNRLGAFFAPKTTVL